MEIARERETTCDGWLLGVTILLLCAGTVAVLDASYARALQSRMTGGDGFYFFKRQVIWAVLSLAVLAISLRVPYQRLRPFWLLGLLASVGLLAAVMVPGIGYEVNGARRWFKLGPVLFQPSELAKLALVLFLARYSDLLRSRIRYFGRGFLPAVLSVALVGALVAKEDLGTAITVVGTGLVMIFVMGARPAHVLGVVFLAVAAAAAFVAIEPYRLERVKAWLDPMHHPDGVGYQPLQGLIALGSGGVWGKGAALGVAKHMYLPAEHTDYIFATIGEEVGLIGCLFLLVVFASLVIRGLTIAHRAHDWFGSLVAVGMTATVGIQVLLNIAVVTCLVPCTGVPLPFISYGGSSLLFTTLAVGIILNVSLHANEIRQEARRERASGVDRRRHGRAHLSRPQRRPLTDA